MTDADFEWQHNKDMKYMAKRLAKLQNSLKTHLENAMEQATMRIMADARRNVGVKTGRLRADISQQVKKIGENVVVGYVGSNVDYALWHEIDYPYLRPAFEQNRGTIRELFEQAVDNAVSDSA